MPLTSIKILDLTRLLPGPYCTMLLADFGAEVIKIEEPMIGDYVRHIDPKIDENSALFHSLNRNKKSVSLNLKDEVDKKRFLNMVEEADVVIESFRPDVMKRLGLDYDVLKRINPQLVYCAITGYGQTGPYKNKPGHDLNYLSYAGLLELMGHQNSKPIIPATTIADIGGGALPAAIGILIALLERKETNEGQFVDVSMLDGVISWLQTVLPDYLATDKTPKRAEQALDGGRANYAVYETKDERFLAVGAVEFKFWESFCEVIDRKELIHHMDAPLRKQNKMKGVIQAVIETKTLKEWISMFDSVDACVSPVLTLDEMVKDPQVIAREMIEVVSHKTLGEIKQIGTPIKLSRTPGKIRTLAPKLNADHLH